MMYRLSQPNRVCCCGFMMHEDKENAAGIHLPHLPLLIPPLPLLLHPTPPILLVFSPYLSLYIHRAKHQHV